jgi:hypothetical protein
MISHTKDSVNAKYDRKRNIAKGSKRVKEIKNSNQTNKKIIAEISSRCCEPEENSQN